MNEPNSAYGYLPVAVSDQATVVATYERDAERHVDYQSEADLERAFITQLEKQAYERLHITSEADLIANVRTQIEALNNFQFTDTEWQRFFTTVIANQNEGIVEKTAKIQEDGHIQLLTRDDGSTKNILLLNKTHIHANRLQVLNQYETTGNYDNRYDVTILVNGLPMIHVELKRRGVPLREAFNQINRYQRDSFWAGSGLYEYIQIFVISNGTLTKYYSNTTRDLVIRENGNKPNAKKTSNSFAFTQWWADGANQPITDLIDFAKTFFAKHTILNILTKYCIFNTQRTLMVMRPYQIVAAERIINRIETSTNQKQYGTLAAGGYIWHTTGSGKTLTSFKTAQLATQLGTVDKVLFVVDRKDLDYQTMAEYDRFQKGAANSNTSTAELKRQIEDTTSKIIITTIQKLAIFIKQNPKHPAFTKHFVIIFDECHRSQFGDMHVSITKAFKKYHLFGFTGTPIFAENAGSGKNVNLRTTAQAFGDKLHTYTIVDAINDRNVLPFRIDYVNTIKDNPTTPDQQVSGIETETALLNPERIQMITEHIRDNFDIKTKRSASYSHSGQRLRGFNSILATASIQAAKAYYNAFTRPQATDDFPSDRKLKVALIYSYNPNEAQPDGLLGEEALTADGLDAASRDFLEDAIQDYNTEFKTSFSTHGQGFENYYKDVSLRMKNRELDLLIVVNMFLTGFDATTLNTLWVDKNLRQHGLIQAFSRTNRILNSVKTYGNIVCYRNLEEETNAALALFGNKDAAGIVLLKPYAEYYGEYEAKVAELLERFPLGGRIEGEDNQKQFVGLFGAILRLINILDSFPEFAGSQLLDPRQIQDYKSHYLDLYDEFRRRSQGDKESIADDVVFEIELAKQVEVNVDYILMLVKQHIEQHGSFADKEIRADIERAINASPTLRNKRDLIEEFLARINADSEIDEEWQSYIRQQFDSELDAIIAAENLRPAQARTLTENIFRDNTDIPLEGTAVTEVMPPVSRFQPDSGRAEKRARIIKRLQDFIDRFRGLLTLEANR
ncbi:type I restriction endonuclease subunit R [Trueperella bialowiezensis]|uniref:Type I restriction enzyme endonuclease subunit n=1 Tax=Trueperella bialowiezensis TaxID=312285 RepID=A0A448PEC8_9ACTO|nr:type I restriction endonuclease subunit R [Trueperella bialowiezensis]VEI13286.1 Type I restriction enzyme EcoR124II R protein [Trueperella bialowiezensis]